MVAESSTSTTTGNFTLAGAKNPGRTFATAGVAVSDTFKYLIRHDTSNEWEVGLGTLLTSTTFSRSAITSSNANALVNFSAGTKTVELVIDSQDLSARGLLRAPQIVTSTNASFAHPVGTRFLVVEGIGAGGASGGASTAAGSCGNGGNSGTWGKRTFTNPALTSNVVVGAGGTAGAAGAAGNAGGNSTFTNNGTTLTLPGGAGGAVLAGATTIAAAADNSATSAATNADISVTGRRGYRAMRCSAATTAGISGDGADSPLGLGGSGTMFVGGTSTAGASGTGFGSGAGGRNNGTTTSNTAGTAGQPGVWIIWEFG
jgi:hypothetical protein